MTKLTVLTCLLAVLALFAIGCQTEKTVGPDNNTTVSDQPQSVDQEIADLQAAAKPVSTPKAPSDLVTVSFADDELTFWPYTGANFSGLPKDPINIVFYGKVDPRDIRAALLSLSGDRTAFGFPDVAPFNQVWKDALGGDVQTCYSRKDHWVGSVIQLACGDYGPTRVHIRLFQVGDWTVCGAHFEVLIPGTATHQVLSWEVAKQVVVADFVRSGLLDADVPMYPTGPINTSPQVIPAMIYNLLPPELQGLTGGPIGTVTDDVPIYTDGQAMILNVVNTVPRVPGSWTQTMVLNFDSPVPKPFCATSEYDYVYVAGPVNFVQKTRLTSWGAYETTFDAEGELTVVPIDPQTYEPIGDPMQAVIRQHDGSWMNNRFASAYSLQYQKLLPWSDPAAGRLFVYLTVNTPGPHLYLSDERCASADYLASVPGRWDEAISDQLDAAKPTGIVVFK